VEYDSDGDGVYTSSADEALVVRYLHESCTAQVITAHLASVVAKPRIYWTTIEKVFKITGKKTRNAGPPETHEFTVGG
jgi:hypothetical protein